MSTRNAKLPRPLSTHRSIYITTCAVVMMIGAPARADISLEELKARLEKLESRTIALESENQQLRKKVNASKGATRTITAGVNRSDYDQGALANQSTERFFSARPNTMGPDIVSNASSWEGVYAGINAGYGLGNIKTYTNTFSVDKATGGVEEISNSNLASYIGGAVAGGQFGYNHLLANRIMIGAEADINWADIYNNVNPVDSQNFTINTAQTGRPPCPAPICQPPQPGTLKNEIGTDFLSRYKRVGVDWIGTARLRFGYDMGNFLPFVTAGFAYGQLTSNAHTNQYGLEGVLIPVPGPITPTNPTLPSTELLQTGNYNLRNSSVLSTGWAAGAGMEYMVAKNWSLKAEYLYISLGGITTPHITQSIEEPGDPAETKTYTLENTGGFGIHQARIGLNYHPDWTIDQPLIKLGY